MSDRVITALALAAGVTDEVITRRRVVHPVQVVLYQCGARQRMLMLGH